MSRNSLILAALLALLFAATPLMKADTLLWATTNGPQTIGNNGPEVDAKALFDIDPTDQTITVIMFDKEANPTDVAQLIAGVQFTISNASSISGSLTVQGSDTTEIDVANKVPTTTTPLDVAWIAHAVANNEIELCTICGDNLKGDAPQELLIGDPNSSKKYSNANGSINDNNAHNPFLLASGSTLLSGLSGYTGSSPTFKITVPTGTLTPKTTITSVTFAFGTTYGKYDFLATEMEDTPEPDSWGMLALGVFLIGASRIRTFRPKRTDTER